MKMISSAVALRNNSACGAAGRHRHRVTSGFVNIATRPVNVVAGQSRPNLVIARVGAGGQVSLYNEAGTTDLLVDVLGWFD